ncbi:hypothetical protein Syun_023625 [Stephania yunnanensis]|uniref:Apyrase n=1 Tax=Stephania yunnanensis TaxID=152371 RepID=A0AAP0F9Z7_9MAGN
MGSWNLSPGALEKNKYLPSLEALGNFSECKSAALMLLQKGKDECSYKSCHIGNTFIPKLHGKVMATENFFYTSEFFGLPPKAFLSDMVSAGEKFCGEHWSKLQKKYPSLDEEDLLRYCFSSAYIVALLHDSLGIALNDDRIGFVNQLGGIPLDWALGAFILHNMSNLEVERPHWISILLIGDSNVLFSLFVISLVVIFMARSTTKFWKPQLKTIYDLEKGRYIVTRVGR